MQVYRIELMAILRKSRCHRRNSGRQCSITIIIIIIHEFHRDASLETKLQAAKTTSYLAPFQRYSLAKVQNRFSPLRGGHP